MAALLVPGLALGYGGAIGHVADTPPIWWWFFGEILLGSTLVAQPAYAAAVRRLGVALATIGAEYTALAVGIVASLAAREAWTPLTVAGGAILCCALAVTFVPSPRSWAPADRGA
jgi:drug/metabolite transporter (DMT)-like permease